MTVSFDYRALMDKALRNLVRDVLGQVAEEGLPGDHHFLITFDTTHPGVDIADWMRQQYPEDMTIVIQHWFDNLVVMEDRFTITLNFNNTPEPMVIPLAALRSFVDPSVEFGLRFETSAEGTSEEAPEADMLEIEDEEPPQDGGAAVVSLDAFRKS